MDKRYWEQFYEKHPKDLESSFARFCLPFLKGRVIELGSGNGRDLFYFLQNDVEIRGIDSAFENHYIVKDNIENYIKLNRSPEYVYTRFFWHSISNRLQTKILKWVKGYLFIEARTIEDKSTPKVFNDHYRNYINVSKLVKKLKKFNFEIEYLQEGKGLSEFLSEDPHIIRIIAYKGS